MPKKITIGTYDKKHRENLAKRAKNVRQLYEAAIGRIMGKAASALSDTDAEKEFRFDDFPVLNKEVDALMQDLADSLQANIEQGDEESWTLANTKNDTMVDSIIGRKRLPQDTVAEWKHPHLEALDTLMDRAEAGMGLSERVWNLSEQFKAELELALELGMGQGKSAAELSRDVRRYLKYPDKLFRRVRDKSGALRLSKAAAAFHPGRGVYRSSYKNALRMTATENNIAYRTADHNRWQALPFVLGIEVRISNNHPTPDICDTFDGKRFPKDFKFTGWHPWCRCYAVSVLASQEEMDAYTQAIIDGEDVSGWQFTGKVESMPKEFGQWMKDNRERITNAKSLPYFIKDNFKNGDPAKGLRWESKKPNQPTEEKASERIKKYEGEKWQHSYVAPKGKGFVVTERERIKEAQVSNSERQKFNKEMRMCKVVADNGHEVEYLRGGNRPAGQTYDIRIDKVNADLKCVTGGAGNIVKYAKKAINKQGGEAVVFEIPNHESQYYEALTEARRKCHGKIFFYFADEKVLKEI